MPVVPPRLRSPDSSEKESEDMQKFRVRDLRLSKRGGEKATTRKNAVRQHPSKVAKNNDADDEHSEFAPQISFQKKRLPTTEEKLHSGQFSSLINADDGLSPIDRFFFRTIQPDHKLDPFARDWVYDSDDFPSSVESNVQVRPSAEEVPRQAPKDSSQKPGMVSDEAIVDDSPPYSLLAKVTEDAIIIGLEQLSTLR